MSGQYGPEQIAGCYGVTVNDPCPEVKIEFPDWAPLVGALTVAGRTDRVTGRPATVFTPPEDLR